MSNFFNPYFLKIVSVNDASPLTGLVLSELFKSFGGLDHLNGVMVKVTFGNSADMMKSQRCISPISSHGA